MDSSQNFREELYVRYHPISDVSAYCAAKMLQKQSHYLNLIMIFSRAGGLIAKAQHKNTTLKYLRMTGALAGVVGHRLVGHRSAH